MQSVPVIVPKSSNDQGISMKDKKILDIDIHIKVYLDNDPVSEDKLKEYNIHNFCNSKRPQNTTLEQIFKEFQALIEKTQAFEFCNFTNFTIIQSIFRNDGFQNDSHGYTDEMGKKTIESFFKELDQPRIKEVHITANLIE